MKSYNSSGTICVCGPFNIVYAVCDINYHLNEDGSFKYVFIPNYSIIELLSNDYFQGIPGLNLDLKEKQYIRENKNPTFISERVPSENREDYYELLSKCGLEYMDPVKYLINTKEQYSGDKLFVTEQHYPKTVSLGNYQGHETNSKLIKNMLSTICMGDNIEIKGRIVDDYCRRIIHDLLLFLYSRSYENNKELQKNGIEKAKIEKKYNGRKPIDVDEIKFIELSNKVKNKEITSKEAARILGISIDKYYRYKKHLQK